MCNCTSEVWSFGPPGMTTRSFLPQLLPKPARDRKETVTTSSLFLGVISGERRRTHAGVADRAGRIAGGLQKLDVKQGDSVCILMRNDIAFLEAAYAAMRLGAYAVPVNWHFKPDEINYVLKDSGTAVLIGHADMLHQLHGAIPAGVTVLSAATPPEILRSYKIDPDHLAAPDFAKDLESWLERQRPYNGPGRARRSRHTQHSAR